MKTSQKGIDLIKASEGLRLEAYKDSVGVTTIGYGSTGSHVQMGQKITAAEAELLLTVDLSRFEIGVSKLVKVFLNQNQFDALVCFSFNLGLGSLGGSTLLKKLNLGDYAGASLEFPKWTHAGGVILPGLVKRRAAEKALFLS